MHISSLIGKMGTAAQYLVYFVKKPLLPHVEMLLFLLEDLQLKGLYLIISYSLESSGLKLNFVTENCY